MQRLESQGRGLTAATVASVSRPRQAASRENSSLDNPQSDSPYWLHELSYSSLASNDSGYTQQPWLPDELCTHCMLCQEKFDLWRWTHHCRDCGGCVPTRRPRPHAPRHARFFLSTLRLFVLFSYLAPSLPQRAR